MSRKKVVVVLLCLVSLMISNARVAGDIIVEEQVHDIRVGVRVAGEILAGVAGGAVVGGGGGLAMYKLGVDLWDVQLNPLPYVGILSGIALGSSVGVYLIGNIGDETGSFPATLAGGALGALIVGGGCLWLALSGTPSSDGDPPELAAFPGVVLSFVSAPIGAYIGFNKTRRYKSPSTSDSHAAPPIYFNLLRVRF